MADPILNLPGEIWKPVVGYEGLYEVSNMGRVKSLAGRSRHPNPQTLHERIIKCQTDARGRCRVCLSRKDGERPAAFVHALVLEAFVGPRPGGSVTCHWNDNPSDNRVENLRWGTLVDNAQDAIRNGRKPNTAGDNHAMAKLTSAQVRCIHALRAQGWSLKELGATFGVTRHAIGAITTGKQWKCLGLPPIKRPPLRPEQHCRAFLAATSAK